MRPQPIVWDVHMEPRRPRRKKLIINVATGWLTKDQNPTQPYSPEEIAQDVIQAYHAGASIWHIHVRQPGTGSLKLETQEKLELHRRACDLVFKECPDIITCPSGADPLTDDSVEARVGQYFAPLVRENPHYAEIAVLNMGTMNLGLFEHPFLFLNRLNSLLEQAKALEAIGVKPEFACYDMHQIEDVKKYFLQHVSQPWLIDTLQGLHNAVPGELELTKACYNLLPQGAVWQALVGGRNWLPLAVQSILLGCDSIRVGKEDAIFMYPDSDERIGRCAQAVTKMAHIAGELGVTIATPKEARERLGLRQLK